MRLLRVLACSSCLLLLAPTLRAQTTTPSPSVTASSTVSVAPAPAPGQDSRVGTFKQVEGGVWIGKVGDVRTPSPGAPLRVADRIITNETGAATVTLKDGTVLTVGPNSQMDLSRFQFDSTTQSGNLLVELLQGSVRVVTGLLGKINPDLFKVSTPTSVVGVRGTDFIVEARAAD